MSIIVSQIFKLFLGEPHEHNEEPGQVSFDCPACAEDKGLPHGQGDGKHKLAINYKKGNYTAIDPYVDCAKLLNQLDIGVNAGHDLSLENIEFFKKKINNLLEVSIGHALITESLILGLEPVIKSYLQKLS